MKERIAILDLGTNTFHLLIAEVKEDFSFEILYKAEEFVKLGEDGLERIGPRAVQRATEQLRKYQQVIDEFRPGQIIGFGTAAIRFASNGDEFIQTLKGVCPMELHKVSGDEEAELIYLGVRQAVELSEYPVLIMDIGGGSTECIIANKEKIFWKQSFPLGASLLKQQFHHKEPISATEQVHLVSHLQNILRPLHLACENLPVRQLIGASGSFDTFARMTEGNFYIPSPGVAAKVTEIPMREFYRLCEVLIRSSLEERLKMKDLIWFRAEMIVVAALLAVYVTETCGIRKITHSSFALKEGVLWQMIHRQ